MGDGNEITLKSLGVERGVRKKPIQRKNPAPFDGFSPLPQEGINMGDLEKHYIAEAFKKANGNDAEAAKLLKMRYYSYRYRRKKLGIGTL